MDSSRPRKARHHHGNLRVVLIQAAYDHVREHGVDSFSLRDATREAGVTSAAAYRHFARRADLLTEVVTRGFRELSAQMRDRVAETAAQGEPAGRGVRRVLAAGEAYVEFARSEPHLFSLMFGPHGAAGREAAGAADDLPSASLQLREALSEAGAVGEPAFLHAWGLAHGLAGLAAAGIADPRQVQEALEHFSAGV